MELETPRLLASLYLHPQWQPATFSSGTFHDTVYRRGSGIYVRGGTLVLARGLHVDRLGPQRVQGSARWGGGGG